jgi:ABC-type phosphate/phosphonate transport system ATPase subunit
MENTVQYILMVCVCEVRAGESILIMGPSSAGKTSLLRAIRLGFSLLCHRINVHKKKKCEKSIVVDPDPGARK